jgi:hypothetical protein
MKTDSDDHVQVPSPVIGSPGRPALDPLPAARRIGATARDDAVKVARAGLIVAIAIGLPAGTTVGVAAQSEAVDPVGFTGWTHDLAGVSEDCGVGSSYEVVDGVAQTRDYVCTVWMGVSDPRFTGTYTRTGNTDEHRGGVFTGGGPLWVYTVVHRVENDEGTWEGSATTGLIIDGLEGDQVVITPETVTFSGTGDYEGLTAVVTMSAGIFKNIQGVIFEGSPPPAPSPVE